MQQQPTARSTGNQCPVGLQVAGKRQPAGVGGQAESGIKIALHTSYHYTRVIRKHAGRPATKKGRKLNSERIQKISRYRPRRGPAVRAFGRGRPGRDQPGRRRRILQPRGGIEGQLQQRGRRRAQWRRSLKRLQPGDPAPVRLGIVERLHQLRGQRGRRRGRHQAARRSGEGKAQRSV